MWRVILGFIIFTTLTVKSYAQYRSPDALTKLKNERILLNEIKTKRINAFKSKGRSATLEAENGFEIFDITPAGIPIYRAPLNAGAAITTGVSTLQNQINGLNLEGENITVGIWDDGLVKDHIEFGNRIISKQGFREQSHTTHVVGTILAKGINAAAKGMAPKALATTWDFYNDDAEMAALARTDQSGLLFSNHSYGIVTGWYYINGFWIWSGDASISNDEDYRFGYYGEIAQVIDQIAYLSPYYTIVWAAGNDRIDVGDGAHPPDGNRGTGFDCIIPESVAKNIITVGAINKVASYANSSSVVMSDFSSWGPTDDGRIKPDLVAAGVGLYSTTASSINSYQAFTGTSMATPNVTGSLVLVQELYSKLHGGNFMRASTLKALAIHTTKEAGSFPGPDYSNGWGLLDVEAAAKILLQEDNKNAFVEELILGNDETYKLDIFSQANKKITVTVCWTDPAGNPVARAIDPTDRMLVNDLDVRIEDEMGNAVQPWILDPANPTFKATTGDNFRDNVEKIEFNNPSAQKYTIVVRHKGELINGKQDFSLIVTCKSSLPSYTTYYWIGNSGNWNDGSHWSLTTGGAKANAIPGAADNVMFDENSFSGTIPVTISLPADAACRKLTWLTDKQAGFALNNHNLKITEGLALSGKRITIYTKGNLLFEGYSDNEINLQAADLRNASLVFAGGTWTVSGKVMADKAEVKKGALIMKNLFCNLLELNALANTTLTITGTRIDSLVQSSIHETVQFKSDSSVIDISANASLNWNNIAHGGKVIIENGGNLQVKGSNSINELQAEGGAVIGIDDASTLHFSNIILNAKQNSLISIQSTGKAAISLSDHQRLCFDFLKIKNVNARGNAVLNAGLNSAIVNADQWLQEDCGNILFSDFDVAYTCSNALTSFTDKSLGEVVSWSWDFGDPESLNNTSSSPNPFHSYAEEGTYLVTLTISDSTLVNTYSKEVIITANQLPNNTILVNDNILMSLQQAEKYQWYYNGEAIEGSVSRTFNYNGAPGNYTVVTLPEAVCNSISQPFSVTGINDDDEKEKNKETLQTSIHVFPNPAKDFIQVYLGDSNLSEIILYNALGQIVLNRHCTGPELTIDVSNFNVGVYSLEVKPSNLLRSKFIISR